MNLYLIPQDKANHILYGAAIGVAASIASTLLGHPELARAAAPVAAGVAGAIKEGLDYLANRRAVADGMEPSHDVELLDFVATLAGGVLVFLRA